ncbi:MAG: hypothetical protein MUF81_17020 [Verrucomicrobia bacterium]|nr:hypothetical protein [Verrucomicrobiota bacterium]
MFATANSQVHVRTICRVWLLGSVALASAAGADSTNTGKARWVAHAREVYFAAQKRFEAEPTKAVAAWEFARAVFDRAEYATNDTERATLALRGIGACRELLARDPKSAPAHYYLGMNLGQLARTKTLGALKLVDEMEREFKAARALDEYWDYAGPDRNLGLLYRDAPSIGSVGSRSRARQHLLRAAALAPNYPENRLNLGEAAVQWRDPKTAQRELAALEELWATAQTHFTGADWEASWADWNSRRQELQFKAKNLAKPLTSPHAAN